MSPRATTVALAICLTLSGHLARADAGTASAEQGLGQGFGLNLSTGLVGVYSPVNLGVILPRLSDRLQIGFRVSWSMPAIVVPHYNRDDKLISYLPWLAYGSAFFHAGTRVYRQLARAYFGLELLAGTTAATESGIIGKNVTIGAIPYLGTELFLGRRFAVFLEVGLTAIFTLVYADQGQMGGATQHGATGTLIRFGPRWYLGQ